MNTNNQHATLDTISDRLAAMVRDRLSGVEAENAVGFVSQYYARVPESALEPQELSDLYGAALAHWRFARQRAPDQARVRVYNPVLEQDGWECPHTVLEVVTDNMPFLVDTVRMELNRQGAQVLLVVHPVYHLQRDEAGVIRTLFGPSAGGDALQESMMHFELVRRTGGVQLRRLQAGLERVLEDLRRAVEDWGPMREGLQRAMDELGQGAPPVAADERDEVRAFLTWMLDGHFTLLGYRVYELEDSDGEATLHIQPGTGRGILRESGEVADSQAFAELPPKLRALAREPRPLILAKSNARATVHRPVNLDYVGVKRFSPDGRVIGEHRFLGLYGSRAYSCLPQDIPVVRRKIEWVLQRAALAPESHFAKALAHILETYPRDELFQVEPEELERIASGILQLGEYQTTRLFVREDPYARFLVCLLYVPRERYDTQVRKRIQRILLDVFDAEEVEFSVSLTEAPLARILFTVRVRAHKIVAYDVRAIESRLLDATLSWRDHLHTALMEQMGEGLGSRLEQRFGEAFPAGYREDFSSRTAVHDVAELSRLSATEELRMSLYRPLESAPGYLRFKVFRYGQPLPLWQAFPILERMGVQVQDERPYRIEPDDSAPLWVHDFGLSYAVSEASDTSEVRSLFQDAFARIWQGEMEDDGFNALALNARLDWRQITLLRAYARYLRQTALTFSQEYMQEALVGNPEIARLLVELFQRRFDPERPKQAEQKTAALTARLSEALDAVQSLDHDRILRSFLALVQASLRSNYYQTDPEGQPKACLALKLDPKEVPGLPEPRPMFEIFVYSPRTEGVHLRGGKVARGGIRWSDRREDFRTEILGLMKAQLVKNAVIVPVGAKGGFVAKRLPVSGDRGEVRAEVEACYRLFISGLLDLTDNLRDGACVPPQQLVRYDGDDPYLVVAADKGTATFSDLANTVAAGYGFWLGDAFASGGRAGYDHKKMGITARGAWESVRQHFRAAEIDYGQQPFSVVGIGDMSGDVFGNGMLWSRNIRLVAAFDHRHIFLDPDPDPELSFRERERLFAQPVSSWADYDPALISPGGGVYSRQLKSVRVSPQAQAALGIEADALAPAELIRAILRAPVDLLWNGGIGTYVKASHERHADIGDRVNDGVRVDAISLRCRVVGEGGNLGLSQAARVEYARQGGRLDTDFIHNAGGVNCSDHEVNIKILLDRVVVDGDLTGKQRNQLLSEMTEGVAKLVLRDSYWQTRTIGLDQRQGVRLLPTQIRFMRHLEQRGQLDRSLEFLPDEVALAERQAGGQGLTRPETALLVSYAKHTLYEELLASDLPEDPCMLPELQRYFLRPVRERFDQQIQNHRLRREILATTVANRLVNRLGSTFAFCLHEELGVPGAAIARAYAVTWEVFALRRLWSGVAAAEMSISDGEAADLLIQGQRLAYQVCRWLLQRHSETIRVATLIERYKVAVGEIGAALPELVEPRRREAIEQRASVLAAEGLAQDLASWAAGLDELTAALDLIEVAFDTGDPVLDTARVYFALGGELELDWLHQRILALPGHDRWHAGARANLRDELAALKRRLCAAVFANAMAGTSPQSKLEAWRHQNHVPLERYQRLFGELRVQEEPDIAMLSVALRELRRLMTATRARPEN